MVVPGDVNSTLAAALVAAKLELRSAHVEAGLRSFDRSMPEEVNRVLTDQVSDLLFTHSRDADENLLREGIDPARVHFVGNTMIDTLERLRPLADARWPSLAQRFALDGYALVTLHRPRNVDEPATFAIILAALEELARDIGIVFPVHPRTRARAGRSLESHGGIRIIEPLGYLDFVALELHAACVLTDSGGIQEETTWLGVPCLTVRSSTERPVTITQGTNRLVPLDSDAIVSAARGALVEERAPRRPDLWDGHAGERIAAIVRDTLS